MGNAIFVFCCGDDGDSIFNVKEAFAYVNVESKKGWGFMIQINVLGKEKKVQKGTTLLEIAKNESMDYILATKNGKLCELYHQVEDSDCIEFVTMKESIGLRAYQRSMTLLMLKAFYDVKQDIKIRIKVNHSLGNAYYCTIDNPEVTKEQLPQLLIKVEERMRKLVEEDRIIQKRTVDTEKAIQLFKKFGMYEKEKLFHYRRGSRTNLYGIDGYEDYFYGYMVASTGYLKEFELLPYEDGFLMNMPSKRQPNKLEEIVKRPKLFQVLKETDQWGTMLGVDTVGSLNDKIVEGQMKEMILVQEALQEKKISALADDIIRNKKKIVLIAGPSSSGKTTFSHRLSIQLKIHGMTPYPIAMDNYFKNREDTPIDENGEYDFETVDALDVELFQQHMKGLIAGERVSMPTFNFKKGCREYKGNYLQLKENDILIIEGIHGLNPKLSNHMEKTSIYKIYISALTQLNVDEHNRIPTTDGRLLRRIIRDATHRGASARDTIGRWESVRRGEENYIFPYQEEADGMFNSAFLYEFSILKQLAEPLLYSVPKHCVEYQEAKRLLKFLDYFLSSSGEMIPPNSLLREFIGGSCFEV